MLKRSLEFLRDNPSLTNNPPGSSHETSSSTTTLNTFFATKNRSILRSSASSVALSMLKGFSSSQSARKQSSDPISTPFDDNINSILGLLDSSQILASTPFAPYKHSTPSSPNTPTTPSPSTPRASSGFDIHASSPLRLNSRAASNPPIILTGDPTATLAAAVATSPPSGKPSPKPRKRTSTNVASYHLQIQLLEALATPFVDASWPSLMQRAGSVTSLPSMLKSSVNEANIFPTSSPMHPLSSKYAGKQAVFTTSSSDPFHIYSANDLACLVFGVSQHELRKLSIMDVIQPATRSLLLSYYSASKDGHVFVCGELFPIIKCNGQSSIASFWGKRNATGDFVVWVIEEAIHDLSQVQVSASTRAIQQISKSAKDFLFQGENEVAESAIGRNIADFVPQANQFISNIVEAPGFKGTAAEAHHFTLHVNDTVYPCVGLFFINSDDPSVVHIDIYCLPHIAGVILLNKDHLKVQNCNPAIMRTLFGYNWPLAEGELSIDSLIPGFSEYYRFISKEVIPQHSYVPGLVIPEHLIRKVAAFRKYGGVSPDYGMPGTPSRDSAPEAIDRYSAFLMSTGIEARYIDGSPFTVDVQVRVISSSHIALWVTYSRNIQGSLDTNEVPSQLSLLPSLTAKPEAMRQSHHQATSSTSSSGSNTSGGTSSANSSGVDLPVLDAAKRSSLGPTTRHPPGLTTTNTAASSNDSSTTFDMALYSVHIQELGAKRRIKKLSDFNILQKMGEGAYGKVLMVEYKAPPRVRVVLKCIIKERILVDTWTRDRKLGTIPNEIRIMVSLRKSPHPNIIMLLDFFEDDEFYHIEMEPHGSPGTDLFDLIELRPEMNEAECKTIFRQVASAVHHLHSHDIVHRDIKDENIIVDTNDRVKLIDFGSAAYLRQGPFDVFVGTIDYAAPEVLAGRPYAGKPQDVWALGILLYTMIYKENPYYNVDEIMEGELRVPFVMSSQSLDLIRKILVRDIQKRPDLDAIIAHEWIA